MKKNKYFQSVLSVLTLFATINCIFEIIRIAKEMNLYNNPGATMNRTGILSLSFEIVLNVLFMFFLVYLTLTSYKKNTLVSTNTFLVILLAVIISFIFALLITKHYTQIDSYNSMINILEQSIKDDSSFVNQYQTIILSYKDLLTSTINLFYSESLLYIAGLVYLISNTVNNILNRKKSSNPSSKS